MIIYISDSFYSRTYKILYYNKRYLTGKRKINSGVSGVSGVLCLVQTLSNIILNIYFACRRQKKYIQKIVLGWKIYFSMAFMLKNIFQYIKLEQLLLISMWNPS